MSYVDNIPESTSTNSASVVISKASVSEDSVGASTTNNTDTGNKVPVMPVSPSPSPSLAQPQFTDVGDVQEIASSTPATGDNHFYP